MEEIFGFNDQFFDERIEVAMLHLEGNDSKYNKVFKTNSVQLFRICFTIIMTAEKVYLKDMRSVYSIFLKTYRVLIM